MEYKIIISISIILIITLISSVSAEEDTTQLINADGDALGISNDDKLGEVVSGDSFSDIREAVGNAKDGDTITLSGTFNGDKKAIEIEKDNLIIKGSGSSKATLDVKGDDSRAFVINGKNVVLENLIFKNMKSDKFGIVLVNNTNCQIINCEFMDNTGKSAGIFINDQADYTSIENCIFRNNHAKYDSESGGQLGGAIDSHASYTMIFNSKFSSNSAIDNGGAVYFTRGTDNLVENCEFTSNKAQNGGAIYITSTSTVRVRNSNFKDNKADYGGAICNYGDLEIVSSEFQHNKALSNITVNSPSYVNCSDDAIIKVTVKGGNNIIDEIWSKNQICIDNKTLNPDNKFSSHNITLTIGDKNFTEKTNDNGEVTFKFNTIDFDVKNYQCTVTLNSYNYFNNIKNFNLKITMKIVSNTIIKDRKFIKKIKKFQAYKPTKKYIKVKYRRYYVTKIYFKKEKICGDYVNVLKMKRIKHTGHKKIKQFKYSWKKASKKSVKGKYKWYKTRFRPIYKYKATKISEKYVNGKCVEFSINKNYKYSKSGKYKKIRSKNWCKYVLPSIDCASNNKKIKKLSKKILKKEAKKQKKSVSKLTDKQKANAILYFVQIKFTYGHYGNTRYGALKSLSKKKLNCVDSTHITIALLRAANIPAKYEAKSIGKEGHCWPRAYLNGKWVVGEPTTDSVYKKFGKSSWTNKNWVKKRANSGTHIYSYKYSKKFVQFGKHKKWTRIIEDHKINGVWYSYYVLSGNAETTSNNINFNNINFVPEG